MLKNQPDKERTALANFHSKRSYVSWAKHVYLYGELDHAEMRMKIYERAKGMCEVCPVPHFVDWNDGEWSHEQKTYGGKRCDGLCCGKWACKPGHRKYRHNGRSF